jgi:hypothetical protein
MNVPTRLVAFAGVIGLAFAGATLAGAALDPTDEQPRGEHSGGGHGEATTAGGHDGDTAEGHGSGHGSATASARVAGGVAISQDGFTLEPDRTFFDAGEPANFTFRIRDERGRVLRDEYELESEREMHLIVARDDAATYAHLHPRKGDDGTWSVQLELPEPGTYRAYADFMIDGKQRTLTTSLFAPGEFRPARLPKPALTDSTDGFNVDLKAPDLRPGRESPLTFAVTRNGRPVEHLEPYLGARGHLVALREGDLAYLHVHPTDAGSGHAHGDDSTSAEAHANEIGFAAQFPSAGRYRLFLQFQAGGEVRTVAYTLEVPR